MKRLMVRTTLIVFLMATKSYAQTGAVTARADAGQASQANCVIVKRMGRVDQVTSHLYSFGKQFRYVEGKLPEGFSVHDRMTDHDVRNLQARGANVIVLESHYTSEDLQQARANCQGEADKTTNQADLKAPAIQTPAAMAGTPTPTLKADDSASSTDGREAALVDVSSTPTGADVYIDEHFFGHTPSTIVLRPGAHEIAIKKSGFILWQKKFKLSTGLSNVDAELVPKAK